jgi:nucleoid DNA-binding protein
MQDLIASYLVQKKECILPLLGSFKIQSSSASLDIADKKIHPFKNEIIYSESADYLSPGLITYVAKVQNINYALAEEEINNWCLHTKMKLDSGEKINFYSVGNLRRNDAGSVFLESETGVNFFEPVPAERVIHKNEEHAVLVGDKETTSAAMNEFYKEDENVVEKRVTWRTGAIVLAAVCLLMLLFYFSSNKNSETGFGNNSSFPVQQPAATYYVPR